MTGKALWQQCCAELGMDPALPHATWAFGAAPDELAALVLAGTKTATASAYEIYALEQEPLPKAGDFSVILDSHDNAVCVIRTTSVSVVPFCEVSAHHAYLEGEGDRSLSYWREVHRAFFTDERKTCGLPFREDMPVCCEVFELVYPRLPSPQA